ncbi:MAG: S41 family peptidase [Polymorphobacter sp.]
MVYRAGDHGAHDVAPTLAANGAVLDLGTEWGIWTRVEPAPADPDTIERLYPTGLFLKRLSPSTLWLRIPDFNDSRAKPLLAALAAHQAELAATPNLVIDLRRNGGGSDYVYAPILPLIYTRPVVTIGIEMRASADNIALRRAIADQIRAEAPEPAAGLDAQNALMAAHPGEFVQPDPLPFSIDRQAKVLVNPRHVAVLIDGAGSTGEQFLLDARQSRKVTLMGQRNSAGVLDFANVVGMATPSGRFRLQWATSRSLRVPADPVDPDGIAPDVRIPADVSDPVAWAQAWLERRPAD